MFFSTSVLIKLLKNSYKNNDLRIGNLSGGLVIATSRWLAWIDNNNVPNKIKAAVIELTGELPKPDYIFRVSKDQIKPEEIEEIAIYENMIKGYSTARQTLIISPVIIQNPFDIRILQNAIGKITGLREDYYKVIDKNAIDLDVEGEPVGPCYGASADDGVYWYNGISRLIIIPSNLIENDLLTKLSEVDFEDELGD